MRSSTFDADWIDTEGFSPVQYHICASDLTSDAWYTGRNLAFLKYVGGLFDTPAGEPPIPATYRRKLCGTLEGAMYQAKMAGLDVALTSLLGAGEGSGEWGTDSTQKSTCKRGLRQISPGTSGAP